MKYLLILLLLIVPCFSQVVLEEKCEVFQNFTTTDSIVYGWVGIGDSAYVAGSSADSMKVLTNPKYVSSIYGYSNQALYTAGGVGQMNAPYVYLDSPFIRGGRTAYLDTTDGNVEWWASYRDDGDNCGNWDMAQPDSHRSATIIFRIRQPGEGQAGSDRIDGWGKAAGDLSVFWVYWNRDLTAGDYKYEVRFYDGFVPEYDVSTGSTSFDTLKTYCGWVTIALTMDRSQDSLFAYINGELVERHDLNRTPYFCNDPGGSGRLTLHATTTSGAATAKEIEWSDFVYYKGYAFTKQDVRALDLPDGWTCTGDFKPYRRGTGIIDTANTLTWDVGFTDSDADNAMYYPVTLPSAGDYTVEVDAFCQTSSGTLKFKYQNNVQAISLTSASTNYNRTFENLTTGSDTLWVYAGSTSDSIVVDNIKLRTSSRNKRNRGYIGY